MNNKKTQAVLSATVKQSIKMIACFFLMLLVFNKSNAQAPQINNEGFNAFKMMCICAKQNNDAAFKVMLETSSEFTEIPKSAIVSNRLVGDIKIQGRTYDLYELALKRPTKDAYLFDVFAATLVRVNEKLMASDCVQLPPDVKQKAGQVQANRLNRGSRFACQLAVWALSMSQGADAAYKLCQ